MRRLWVVVVLCGASLVAPAEVLAQIFQPGTQPQGAPGGLEVAIQSSNSCQKCHGGYDDADDYEPHESWRGSMMANAARDPVFRAALAIAEEDHPDAADFCVRCHSPPAWLRGRSELPEWSAEHGPRLAPDDIGFLSPDLDGVACMVCHRVDERAPGPYLQNAQLLLRDGAEADLHQGPYETSPEGELRHPIAYNAFLGQSELCGQCHDIVNPVVDGQDAQGQPLGRPFAIERTFSEWKHSAFSTRETCQGCHMPRETMPRKAADEGRLRDYFRRHDLTGGNYWVPRALAAEAPDRSEAYMQALLAAGDRAETMLQEAAEVEIQSVEVTGDQLDVVVRVTNLTGHKLPTGYPEGRRMWLEVALVDDQGQVLAGSGLMDESTGHLLQDQQARTYEVKLGQDDEPSFHFILNNRVLLDNRIPPEGFDPPHELDMEPVGRDYTDATGSYRHWDDAPYTFRACSDGETSVRARLRFQTTTAEYIEFLRDHAPASLDPAVGQSWGAIAYQAWLDHGGREPIDMAMAEQRVDALPACDQGCSCATGGSGRSSWPWFAGTIAWIVFRRRKRSEP